MARRLMRFGLLALFLALIAHRLSSARRGRSSQIVL
jgi:hypothetical protein